jgi:hypothetical protein
MRQSLGHEAECLGAQSATKAQQYLLQLLQKELPGRGLHSPQLPSLLYPALAR